jgi:hypothetical protein
VLSAITWCAERETEVVGERLDDDAVGVRAARERGRLDAALERGRDAWSTTPLSPGRVPRRPLGVNGAPNRAERISPITSLSAQSLLVTSAASRRLSAAGMRTSMVAVSRAAIVIAL